MNWSLITVPYCKGQAHPTVAWCLSDDGHKAYVDGKGLG